MGNCGAKQSQSKETQKNTKRNSRLFLEKAEDVNNNNGQQQQQQQQENEQNNNHNNPRKSLNVAARKNSIEQHRKHSVQQHQDQKEMTEAEALENLRHLHGENNCEVKEVQV